MIVVSNEINNYLLCLQTLHRIHQSRSYGLITYGNYCHNDGNENSNNEKYWCDFYQNTTKNNEALKVRYIVEHKYSIDEGPKISSVLCP